jgi:poly(ADP-ribose) glycohydrolase
MEENESIYITGAEQFSSYTGYGGSFAFDGNYDDPTPTDPATGTCRVAIVAIDAVPYYGKQRLAQYGSPALVRELNKAHAGFSVPQESTLTALLTVNTAHDAKCSEGGVGSSSSGGGGGGGDGDAGSSSSGGGDAGGSGGSSEGESWSWDGAFAPVATGNWGCGVFGGDPQLKALLQWAAASLNGRATVYFPFDDERLTDLKTVTDEVLRVGWTVGRLVEVLLAYAAKARSRDCSGVFAHIMGLVQKEAGGASSHEKDGSFEC